MIITTLVLTPPPNEEFQNLWIKKIKICGEKPKISPNQQDKQESNSEL